MANAKLKVAYYEGRPHGHPTHSLYAKSVDAEFFHIDKYLRYQDLPKSNKLKRYLSWILTSFLIPKKKYDVFLTQEPYFPFLIMKTLGLMGRDQKLISMFGTHTLYFIKEKKYSSFTTKMLILLFSKYDRIICEGEMQKSMLEKMMKPFKKKPKIDSVFNGSNTIRLKKLLPLKPNLGSNRILTIANAPNKDRVYYKGLDLNLAAFNQLIVENGDFYYDIIGEVTDKLKSELMETISIESRKRVSFLGQINDFENHISDYSLCLHVARGEAWGITVNDCMAAGIPIIVSEWTGAKQIVKEVSGKFIVTFKTKEIVEVIQFYYGLSIIERKVLSEKCKSVSFFYSETKAIAEFKKYFYQSLD